MNRKLIALVAATMVGTTSYADMKISGTYEGVASTGGSAATYTQDLDLKLQANVGDTTVVASLENLTGETAVKTKQMYIATKLEGLDFKGGHFKVLNGEGLLQKKSLNNQMTISTKLGDAGIAVNQLSGEGSATVDLNVKFLGTSVKIQNAANSARFITTQTSVMGVDLIMERNKTLVGTNTALSASTTIQGLGVTGVFVDVKDTDGVTQNDGIVGDISDAATGSNVKAGIVTYASAVGDLTGKYIVKNDLVTMVGKIKRGDIEYGYSKTENSDSVLTATLNVAF